MGSKTTLGSYLTKRANNGVNLVTSRNINTRLARPNDAVVSGMNAPLALYVHSDVNGRVNTRFEND